MMTHTHNNYLNNTSKKKMKSNIFKLYDLLNLLTCDLINVLNACEYIIPILSSSMPTRLTSIANSPSSFPNSKHNSLYTVATKY